MSGAGKACRGGGRTYHMPNYATSYANEKSNLITIHLDQDKGDKKVYLIFTFLVLLLVSLPTFHLLSRPPGHLKYTVGEPSTQLSTEPLSPDASNLHESFDSPAEEEASGDSERGQGYGPRTTNPSWDDPRPADQCTAFGEKEYTARLQGGCVEKGIRVSGLKSERKLCETAPATVNGIRYERPTSCKNKGWFSGMRGQWEVEDPTC
ncbi:hypothetical protein DFP72DRAFT_842181 [Ephemerocybe angulata]|uniref:Uncharacterized protein n=1 Tax=Ephemerocybe angulata TaxID=980116 RepID=A0A8H6IBN9_9AGAR|nr:hypothetical protein DFP72DRAFT_842181 [Tulosesus angulatus]